MPSTLAQIRPDLAGEYDGSNSTLTNAAQANALGAAMRRSKNAILDLANTCYTWRELRTPKKSVRRLRKEKLEQLVTRSTFGRVHLDIQCAYSEVTAATERWNGAVVPVLVQFEAGYDCE